MVHNLIVGTNYSQHRLSRQFMHNQPSLTVQVEQLAQFMHSQPSLTVPGRAAGCC